MIAAIDLRTSLEGTGAQVTAAAADQGEGLRVFPPSVAALGRAVAVVRARGLPVRLRGNGDAPWAPPAGGVLLDLHQLDRIASVDGETGIARVEAGCSVASLEIAVRRAGSTLGPLLPSVRAGSVGAWLAGPTRGERGVPGSRRETAALSVAAVLADGRLAESRAAPRSATGPDLDHLALGNEGRLCVVAAAWIRLFPEAASATVCARAPDVAAAVRALQKLCADRLAPSRARIAKVGSHARIAAAWDGAISGDRDAFRAQRTLLALGCTPEVEDADTIEFARASAPAEVVEADASWAHVARLGAPAPGNIDLHFVGLHAGGSLVALALHGLDVDDAARIVRDAGARVTAPNRLRDAAPGWTEMGAAALWSRLVDALAVAEAAP